MGNILVRTETVVVTSLVSTIISLSFVASILLVVIVVLEVETRDKARIIKDAKKENKD